MNDTPSRFDVIIAGAGPVGLFLACELRLGGLSVLVLEASDSPASPLKGLPFGLRGLSTPTLDAFDRRGLLDAVAATRPRGDAKGAAHWTVQARPAGGHFAGIQFFLDRIDPARWPYRLSGAVGAQMASDMQSIETVLAGRAAALGADIRRGCSVEGFVQMDDQVTVHTGGDAFHAGFLVGCDGGRSTVRKVAGFDFAGTEPEFTGYSLEVDLADPDALPAGRHYTPAGMYTFARPGTVAMVDFDGGACHRRALTPEHVQTVLRRVSGVEVTVTGLKIATTWTDRAFQASAYRKGRVLLAGDAAHIHSPLGGQGLNLGLGDAMNLGWKLAATVRGGAPDGLLDSYFAERHPIGAQVLDWSRAQVALMRPTASTRALGTIVRDLIDTRDGATYFADRVWGASLRYDLGGDHPLIGMSVPDFEPAAGPRIGERLRTGRGLLLDFDGRPALQAIAARRVDRIDYVCGDVEDRLGLGAALVRPDGFVAWACDGAPDIEAMSAAMSRWFGPAAGD